MTQEQTVKNRLKEVGYVDNFWAIENYILRLGAIMCQLKKQGWEFKTYFGEGKDEKNYHYSLIKSPPKEQKDCSINGIQPFPKEKQKEGNLWGT